MIGDGWTDEPAVRPGPDAPPPAAPRRVAVVTGTRAEFGLLKPVMHAVREHADLELLVIAAGAHLISPADTFREVKAAFPVADGVPMQIAGRTGRDEDVQSLARGVARFGRSFERLRPDWVVVLGDRIEALAGALAGSVGGLAVAHIHGGDRAEGVADEAMRHAITKLAHLHLAATPQSGERIARLGERPEFIHIVGSPAIDGLDDIPPLDDAAMAALGDPEFVFLLHPVGRTDEHEEHVAAGILGVLRGVQSGGGGRRVLALHPNHDPGRTGIVRAIEAAGVPARPHLPREQFVGLLKRLAVRRGAPGGARGEREPGALVGNSSAALIEAAALRCPAVDIGPRQAGRERAANVITSAGESPEQVARALVAARAIDRSLLTHPYGEGHAGPRIAALLASTDPRRPSLLRKRNAY